MTNDRGREWYALARAGMKTCEIAEAAGKGVTKSMVIGAIYRFRTANNLPPLGRAVVSSEGAKQAAAWHTRHKAGESYSTIAAKEATPDKKITKDAVYGAIRAHRKKLSKPKAAPAGEAHLTQPSFASDTKLCRHIAGDPKTDQAVYCGHAHIPGSAWCQFHKSKMYKARVDAG